MLYRSKLAVAVASLLLPQAFSFAEPKLTVDPAPKADAFVPRVLPQKIEGGYAIVVSAATQSDGEWAKVIDTLKQKYGSAVKVFIWDKSIADVKPGLSEMMPRYTCFVATPKEAAKEFVAQVHRLARNLNDDPYPDTIWAILTGLTPADALRIASTSEPLEIHNVVSTTGVSSGLYDSVFTVSDGGMGSVYQKGDAAKSIHPTTQADGDRAHTLVDAIHAIKPDMFVTSAHAGERILEMPFSHGVLIGKNGQVIGLPTSGAHGKMHLGDHGWELSSPNPKVWLAAGNCLIGHIADNNSMALAMMHSGGVTQMVGYTVTTWYGAGGWGTLNWFQSQPGRFTLAESFFINDADITHRLATEFPGRERYAVKVYNDEDLDSLANEMGSPFPTDQSKAQDLLGLTWDHDTVAFYGDPAWSARVATHPCDFEQTIAQTADNCTLTVKANRDSNAKAFAFLPTRIKAAAYISSGNAKDVLLTDHYVLANFGHLNTGETRTETFDIGR